ncbi:hypothetical protein CU097_007392 [Rhizopus azygosporus]|uniref:Peptidase A1 domain-containing protein n=1 Tax=Rhizopus azygosporus TaxID=86630 RepID=A0A367JRT2_RHIAZ|nr:hypothetical protein CU097_007392 [Rhizopus azygosporus]
MRLTAILFTSVTLLSTTYAATLEKRCHLRREPITVKNGLPLGEVKVGSPPQPFRVLFDTSNSLTWVPSTDCHTPICRKNSNKLYSPNTSSTAVNLHQKESIKFDEGVCIDVRLYRDTVSVAGLEVPNQLFGAAYSVKGLDEDHFGFLGLGNYADGGNVRLSSSNSSSSLTSGGNGAFAPNAFQLGAQQGSAQFGFYTTSPSSGFYQKRNNDGHNGEFIIGGIDHNVYKGGIAYFKLPTCDYGDSPYWKTELKCVKLGNKIDVKLAPKTLASFSTGTSHMLAPSHQADLLHAALDAHYDEDEDVYKIDCCEDLSKFPDLKFDFNGYRITLPPKAYLKKDNDKQCHSLIGRNTDDKNWILGGYFSQWFYQVYDASNSQIGLALTKGESDVKIDKLH